MLVVRATLPDLVVIPVVVASDTISIRFASFINLVYWLIFYRTYETGGLKTIASVVGKVDFLAGYLSDPRRDVCVFLFYWREGKRQG